MSLEARLPDGRSLAIDGGLSDILSAGVVVVDGVTIGPGDGLRPAIEAEATAARERWEGRQPSEIPPLQEARRLYRSVGIPPTRIRPSSEALLRRILRGLDLYAISNAVDACNLASLTFLLPIGLYDLDKVRGDARLRIGLPGEEYPGIRKGPVHLEGRLGLFDDEGPFGSPTSDSARTCVDDGTGRLLGVVMATADYPGDDLLTHARLLADLLCTHCGGRLIGEALLGTGS